MEAHGEVIPDPSRVLVGSVVVTHDVPRETIRVFEHLSHSVVRQRGSDVRLRHATDPSESR